MMVRGLGKGTRTIGAMSGKVSPRLASVITAAEVEKNLADLKVSFRHIGDNF